jgi:co-chaperonin GroES (HSP10)
MGYEKLQPSRGFLFVRPVSDIPKAEKNSKETGFGIKSDKSKPEEPYQFKVLAVGAPRPFDGCMIESEAQVGDIVSHTATNKTLREDIHDSGFLMDGVHILVMDFRDVLGIWR